jgi:drug/metabolite transporter (DMT)-like permease
MKNSWILLAILSMIISGSGVIFLKYISLTKYNTNFFLLLTGIFIGIICSIILILKKKTFFNSTNINKCDNILILLLIAFTILMLLNSFIMIKAVDISPNIGYTHTIINFNVILSLIAGYFLFKQNINYKIFIGIIFSLIGFIIIGFNCT